MATDLFLALLDKGNARGTPLLAGLLYAYCPAAAHWWLTGVDPVPLFDPVWAAAADFASGLTLREALVGHGFEDLLGAARGYIDEVTAFRRQHAGLLSPELMPTFSGGKLELYSRFGLGEAIAHFGGDARNFFAYIRAWAFLIPDWAVPMRLLGERIEFSRVPLRLGARGVRQAVRWWAWLWSTTVEGRPASRLALGGLAQTADQLRFSLFRSASPEGDRPWNVRPEVWVLDETRGASAPFEAVLTPSQAGEQVLRLARLAASPGGAPPLAAFSDRAKCSRCGFGATCYTPEGALTPIILQGGLS
jgi:hypothetical protein